MDSWVPDLSPLWLSLRLAGVTTLVLLVFGGPLAWWLARTGSRMKPLVEAMVAVPLVLPPTVLGFYLLIGLGPQGPVSTLVRFFGGEAWVFSFPGLVVGSVVYSLPFVVQPMEGAFAAVARSQLEAAATLGAGPWDRFLHLILPQARGGIIASVVLGFAHTLGEFGVVLMIGGNIPGRTRVLSIAIYDHVEALEYAQAHLLAGVLLVVSLAAMLVVYGLRPASLGVRT